MKKGDRVVLVSACPEFDKIFGLKLGDKGTCTSDIDIDCESIQKSIYVKFDYCRNSLYMDAERLEVLNDTKELSEDKERLLDESVSLLNKIKIWLTDINFPWALLGDTDANNREYFIKNIRELEQRYCGKGSEQNDNR